MSPYSLEIGLRAFYLTEAYLLRRPLIGKFPESFNETECVKAF